MKLKCRLGFHNWSNWEEGLYESTYRNLYGEVTGTGQLMGQERKCHDCGEIEIKRL